MSRQNIFCRARLENDCLHGQPDDGHFDCNEGMKDDGTFDGHSIVCTPCYVRLMPLTPSGQGLNHELHDAIRLYRQAVRP